MSDNIKSLGALIDISPTSLSDKIEAAVSRAMAHSYTVRPMRNKTAHEDKRRAAMCFFIMQKCREADHPILRAMDVLDVLLVMAIDGDEIIIEEGGMWCVSGSGLQLPISKAEMEKQVDINTEGPSSPDSIINPSLEQILVGMEANEKQVLI
jgi:hypothetical protein